MHQTETRDAAAMGKQLNVRAVLRADNRYCTQLDLVEESEISFRAAHPDRASILHQGADVRLADHGDSSTGEDTLGAAKVVQGPASFGSNIADVCAPAERVRDGEANNLHFGSLRNRIAIEVERGMRAGVRRSQVVAFRVQTILPELRHV
jgi:hypothetical protein